MYKNIRGANILYIEDDEIISLHFVAILEKLGAKVVYCVDYDQAVTKFEEGYFDVIITDIRLSNGTGLDVIRFVRLINKSIPVIITSGYAETKYLLDAIEYDVAKYFIKPFKETELFDYIDKVMGAKASLNVPSDTKELADGFSYSFRAKALFRNNIECKLSAQEITLIELLLTNRGRVVGYEEIRAELGKTDGKITIDTLRTVIKNIRKKSSDNLILTQSGLGYKIP